MLSAPAVKGLVIIGIKDFIREHHSPDGLQQLLSRLTPDEQQVIGPSLMTLTMVPATILCRLFNGIRELFGHGSGDYFGRILAFVAEQNLNTFMRLFIKIGTPAFVANGAPMVWKHYFNVGRLIKTTAGDQFVEYLAEGGEAYGEALCVGILGWGRRAIEMSGGRKVVARHDECIYRNQPRCVYRFEWSQ